MSSDTDGRGRGRRIRDGRAPFRPLRSRRGRRLAITLIALCGLAPSAYAWDSRTHELITRLAIAALPTELPLKTGFARNASEVEEYSIEPDTVLRPLYGEAEARRHYIDLEYYGADPFARLDPDLAAMRRQYGARTLDRSGTLPWSITSEAAAMEAALRAGDCVALLRHAGYLAHYVGDATQPLHTTRFFDGPTASDRGMHARLEGAVDHRTREIGADAADGVRWQPITSLWAPIVAQLRESNELIPQVVAADRTAREEAGRARAAYTRRLMALEQPLIVRQIADAASLLASIWAYEDRQAGTPPACTNSVPAAP